MPNINLTKLEWYLILDHIKPFVCCDNVVEKIEAQLSQEN